MARLIEWEPSLSDDAVTYEGTDEKTGLIIIVEGSGTDWTWMIANWPSYLPDEPPSGRASSKEEAARAAEGGIPS